MLLLGMQPISYHVYEIQVGNFLKGVKTHGHVKAFTLPALIDIAELHGFKVIDTYGCGFYKLPTFLSKILARIDKRHAVYIGVLLQKP
ncbi:hypothetical protein [Pyrococcus kukulkanii]|uniref:Uncharacterized protein n=1 Tax=Pyrococcus kukulkanii TaxID=1609559 RepID=A0ABV4T4P0_9EURY